jgi:hypothetical protein
MFSFAIVWILVGAIVLVLGTGLIVRALLSNRSGKTAPFRDYLCPEPDGDILQQSPFTESGDWLADRHARFAPFRLRDSEANERGTGASGAPQLDRESN